MLRETSYQNRTITLSMIKWTEHRKIILWFCRTVGLVKRHTLPTSFIPSYELAIYDGAKSAILSKQAEIIFYFADELTALDKLNKIEQCVIDGGPLGDSIQNFIRNSDKKVGVLVTAT